MKTGLISMDRHVDALQDISLPPGAGVGIDLVQIARFETLQHDERFLTRVFTPDELAEFGHGVARKARLAARWAAKEACAKALGCGIGSDLTWQDVVLTRDSRGKPHIHLSDTAAKHHNHPELHVSLSHDGDYAIAIVWIPPRSNQNMTGVPNETA